MSFTEEELKIIRYNKNKLVEYLNELFEPQYGQKELVFEIIYNEHGKIEDVNYDYVINNPHEKYFLLEVTIMPSGKASLMNIADEKKNLNAETVKNNIEDFLQTKTTEKMGNFIYLNLPKTEYDYSTNPDKIIHASVLEFNRYKERATQTSLEKTKVMNIQRLEEEIEKQNQKQKYQNNNEVTKELDINVNEFFPGEFN